MSVCGEARVELHSLVLSPCQLLLPMESRGSAVWDPDDNPLLGVSCDPAPSAASATEIQLRGSNLHSDQVVTPAPYFTLSLVPNSVDRFPVGALPRAQPLQTLLYRSEVAYNNASPKWNAFTLPSKYLSSPQAVLQVSCYHFVHNRAEDVLVGRFTATFFQLLNGSLGNKFMVSRVPSPHSLSQLHSAGQRKHDGMFIEVVTFRGVPEVVSFVKALKSG